jgi:hypothetical protein
MATGREKELFCRDGQKQPNTRLCRCVFDTFPMKPRAAMGAGVVFLIPKDL